ncbi:GNAT family N-acetyltransferase [Novosphingobium flavum]|uniref:GNAT family N-acetyltransferase n=1 Tax=Novosphingobium flavum TaxID=1778672 RepID=A0A7X1FSV1_9SPHN|nr:GNAT family N-acetyltransferase [Novosphingobium flavum]MBC2666340.1 GNAT family N-acetyltransferase [Novosphingobium flavum]
MVNDVIYLAELDKASRVPGLADQLNAALADARGPFDRAEWWRLLCAHGGVAPFYALARSDGHSALMALTERGGVIRPLANWYTFRWRPLVSRDAASLPLFEALGRDLPRRGWRLVLEQVPDEDGSATALTEALRRAGWAVRMAVHDSNHVLALDGRDYAAFLAGRPGALRTMLKRRSGRVATELFGTFRPEVWQAYEEIYAASWKPEEGNPALLRAFAEAEGAAGRLRMGLAHVEGRAVAAQFWTVEDGTAYIHKLAHREDGKAQSPGTVLSAALFEQVIDRDRVKLVDFGTGDNAYKRDWMDDIRLRYQIDALWPKAPRAWPRLARRLLRR